MSMSLLNLNKFMDEMKVPEPNSSKEQEFDIYEMALSMIVMIFIVLCMIFDPSIPIPKFSFRFPVNYSTAPLIGVCFLLVCRIIPPSLLLHALIDDDGVKPIPVIIIFFTLAYICTSYDCTGTFRAVSIMAIKYIGGYPRLLLISFFILAGVMTVFVSSDVVCLTLTPIILNMATQANIDPKPYLIAQYFSANTWTILLLIANTTNLIVGLAYDINFLEFLAWFAIPTVVAGVSLLFMIGIVFMIRLRQKISGNQDFVVLDAVNDKIGAIIYTFLLGACIICLTICNFIGIEMYIITSVFCLFAILRDVLTDIVYDIIKLIKYIKGTSTKTNFPSNDVMSEEKLMRERPSIDIDPEGIGRTSIELDETFVQRNSEERISDDINVNIIENEGVSKRDAKNIFSERPSFEITNLYENDNKIIEVQQDKVVPETDKKIEDNNDLKNKVESIEEMDKKKYFIVEVWLRKIYGAFKSFATVFLTTVEKLPWGCIPFICGMFIMVEALDHVGWISLCAKGLSFIIFDNVMLGVVGCTIISALFANILSNQPMTIFFVKIIQHVDFIASPKVVRASLYGVILGSNFGVNLTLYGALSGILWTGILKRFNFKLHPLKFTLYGIIIMPLVIILTSVVVGAEILIMLRNE